MMKGKSVLFICLVIVDSPGLFLAKDDKIQGSQTPQCTICELIFGRYSPQCFAHCTLQGPTVYRSSTAPSEIRRFGIICAYCQFLYGVQSPKCATVCHGRRPTENHGTNFCYFCRIIYGPNYNQCQRFCLEIIPSMTVTNDVICALCEVEHGTGSLRCSSDAMVVYTILLMATLVLYTNGWLVQDITDLDDREYIIITSQLYDAMCRLCVQSITQDCHRVCQ